MSSALARSPAGRCPPRARCGVATRALFANKASRQLWNYEGSCVRRLSLEELQLLHRLSFGHRNQRSYLVVLHRPDSPPCQAFEQEVERLAAGLRHEQAFVATALDVSQHDAAHYAGHILGISSVPAVLLYPEAARGFLRFLGPDMSAEGMLAAVNRARLAAWPATATQPGAREWRLLEHATPLAVTARRAAAASGGTDALLTTLHQQMAPLEPTPLDATQGSSTWGHGRLALWGGMLLLSLVYLAWDLRLSDAWDEWCLARRQAARARGRRFSMQENTDDLAAMLLGGLQQQRPANGDAAAPVGGDLQAASHVQPPKQQPSTLAQQQDVD